MKNDHTPAFPQMNGWRLDRLDGESTPEESKAIEGMFSACLGLLNAGYSLEQAKAFILAAPELLAALEIGLSSDLCPYCGRDNTRASACTSDDCPGVAAIDKARVE